MRLDAASATWPEARDHLAAGSGVAVLPFGALEQHGPHLPLATDTLTAVAVAEALSDRLDALLLPAVPFGETWNMSGYPGTLSLSPDTITAIAVDLGRAAVASGARALVIVNGDWGNRAPLQVAVHRLLSKGLPAISLDHPGLDAAAERLRRSAPAAPGLMHAEEIETSLMQHIAPEQVRDVPVEPVYPDFPADLGVRPMRLHPFSPSGVFGDPSPSSAETGAALLEAVLDASRPILDAFLATLPAREPADRGVADG